MDKRILGSILLIAGCCIGAGMLGLPIITGISGFFPSLIIFIFIWMYMLSTAKLLAEAISWFDEEKINLFTISHRLLGKYGKLVNSFIFLFLFYCILTAYFVKGGEIISEFLNNFFTKLPSSIGAFILLISSIIITIGGVQVIDKLNFIFMVILITSFVSLNIYSLEHTNFKYLTHSYWPSSLFLLPFLVTSFGFHNIIPSISQYLLKDNKKLNLAINLGGFIPLIVYLIWILIMLSVIPFKGENSIIDNYYASNIVTIPLAKITGSKYIYIFSNIFAFTAIVTSVLGQGLSIVDFLIDASSLKKKKNYWIISIITFLPPFLFSQYKPNIFFELLSIAGGLAAIILYGFMPALIVWRGRYHFKYKSEYITFRSKYSLIIIMLIALFIFVLEILKNFGIIKLIT